MGELAFKGVGWFILFFLLGGTFSCATRKEVPAPVAVPREIPYTERPSPAGRVQYGIASWYGPDFHGRPTASGEIYDMYSLTAAHPTLPMGTYLMVTNLENGRSVEVVVNDRGPFVKRRVIDLSYAAARMLGMIQKGTAPVRLEILHRGPQGGKASFLSSGSRPYTLQLGSFVDRENAERMKSSLTRYFENVYIVPFFSSSRRYYRVRIGRFNTKEEALKIAYRIVEKGYPVLITREDK